VNSGEKALQVEKARVLNHMGLIKFAGINTPEAAQTLRGQVVYMDREMDTLEEGEYYIQDLIGLEVFDAETGERYGTVTDYLETGANGVYVLNFRDGTEQMVPAIPDVVKLVDVENNRLEIIPLKGLFEDAAEV
jgi:16S rRNA processing protein RimM